MTATQSALFDSAPVVQSLEDILEYLDSIPDINAGGCGISALAIYRWCKANGVGVPNRPFVIISDDSWDVEHNNQLIEEGEISGRLEFPHIVTEIDGLLWDSTGNENDDNRGNFSNWHYRCCPLNEDELLTLINQDEWNYAFDRSPYVEDIAENLGIDLSDVVIEF